MARRAFRPRKVPSRATRVRRRRAECLEFLAMQRRRREQFRNTRQNRRLFGPAPLEAQTVESTSIYIEELI